MRNALVIGTTTLTLLFGGAGVAHATELGAPAPATTTTLAQEVEIQEEGSDNTGLWGLLGLLGLAGLAGLKRRKDVAHPAAGPGTGRVT